MPSALSEEYPVRTLVSPCFISLLCILAVAACTTTGTGVGSTRNNDVSATFTWQSIDDRTGTLNAAVSTGEAYSGKYFQITAESRVDQLGPLWDGWRGYGRGGWRYWDSEPRTAFVTHYSGRVVANLLGPNGTHMRCRFQLIRPASGMAGGGQGECQLPSGKTIDATFATK
jgi:hypothetical protein